jgi:hypothetical protein
MADIWACNTCTYENPDTQAACGMCEAGPRELPWSIKGPSKRQGPSNRRSIKGPSKRRTHSSPLQSSSGFNADGQPLPEESKYRETHSRKGCQMTYAEALGHNGKHQGIRTTRAPSAIDQFPDLPLAGTFAEPVSPSRASSRSSRHREIKRVRDPTKQSTPKKGGARKKSKTQVRPFQSPKRQLIPGIFVTLSCNICVCEWVWIC